MAILRDIRQRIVGVKKTQKITSAMKMVASARLHGAKILFYSAQRYPEAFSRILEHHSEVAKERPIFHQRKIKHIAFVVITSDRGLCGAFNSNVIRKTLEIIGTTQGGNKLICVGSKGYRNFIKFQDPQICGYTEFSELLKFESSKKFVNDFILDPYAGGGFDKVILIYNQFISPVRQQVIVEQLLPINFESLHDLNNEQKCKDYIYEFDREVFPSLMLYIEDIANKYIHYRFWARLLESNAAEQGARMIAMDNATINASELIRTLQLSYNKARQASITKELLEIVGGAEALAAAD